jgi:hypothetical protein
MTQNTRFQTDMRERFIPVNLDRLIEDLMANSELSSWQKTQLRRLCQCYQSIQHAQTYRHIVHLKEVYAPVNPDEDCLVNTSVSLETSLQSLKNELALVLQKANYRQLSEQELNTALNKVSPHGLQVSVDFDDFADVFLMYRGAAVRDTEVRHWKTLYLKKETAKVDIFRRLFVLIQPQNRQRWIEHLVNEKKLSLRKAKKKVDKTFQALGVSGEQDLVYLKVFKDIPRDDLEMLFPNIRVKIKLFDKIKLAIMGGGGTAGGVMATISKLSAALDPVSAVVAIGGLIGVLWRQVSKIFRQRAKYNALLTKNLYFYNLDNNMGAITYILDAAEAEECKEALLAYYFLYLNGSCTSQQLDLAIEEYLFDNYRIPMDFDVQDGLKKLTSAGLLRTQDERLHVIDLDEALDRLSAQWQAML